MSDTIYTKNFDFSTFGPRWLDYVVSDKTSHAKRIEKEFTELHEWKLRCENCV